MPIDSFGYQVMSLRELKAAIDAACEKTPKLLDQPVWTGNIIPVHRPVKAVTRDQHGLILVFENGGNYQ